jgi:hypothetical protein
MLRQTLQVPIGFAVIGWGGTSSAQWQPQATAQPGSQANGFLFSRLTGTAQNIIKFGNGFRAVLWHQGESDVLDLNTSAGYETNTRAMIAAFRQQTVATTPWLIAVAAWLPGDSSAQAVTDVQDIEAAQNRLRADQLSNLYPGSITDDLQSCNSVVGDGGYRDCIHNNSAHLSYLGLQIHGQRWHDAVLAFLATMAAPPTP